jgi:hypothetical protein
LPSRWWDGTGRRQRQRYDDLSSPLFFTSSFATAQLQLWASSQPAVRASVFLAALWRLFSPFFPFLLKNSSASADSLPLVIA